MITDALAFDISLYFNSIYHHDLTEWFEASIAAGPYMQLGQFLRECNKGRSIDCLPHGFHPCKAIGLAFLHDIDNAVQARASITSASARCTPPSARPIAACANPSP